MRAVTLVKAALGVLAGLALVAGYLYWIDQGRTTFAVVGDCVNSPKPGELVRIPCDRTGALTVLAKFPGDDSNRCDGVPGTTEAFVEYPSDAAAFVLCAGTA